MNKVDIFLSVVILLLIFMGYKRGAVSELRYYLGVVLGLVAIPVVYPPVYNLLLSLGLSDLLKVDGVGALLVNGLIPFILKGMTFAIVMFLCKLLVNQLFSAYHPVGALKVVDGIGGALIALLKLGLVIWVFNWLLNAGGSSAGYYVEKAFGTSQIIDFVTKINPIEYIVNL